MKNFLSILAKVCGANFAYIVELKLLSRKLKNILKIPEYKYMKIIPKYPIFMDTLVFYSGGIQIPPEDQEFEDVPLTLKEVEKVNKKRRDNLRNAYLVLRDVAQSIYGMNVPYTLEKKAKELLDLIRRDGTIAQVSHNNAKIWYDLKGGTFTAEQLDSIQYNFKNVTRYMLIEIDKIVN